MRTITVKKSLEVEVEVDLEDILDNATDAEIEEECDARGLLPAEKGLEAFDDREIRAEYEHRTDGSGIDAVLERVYQDMRSRTDVPQSLRDLIYSRIGRIL